MAQIKRGHKHTEADLKKHDAYTKKKSSAEQEEVSGGGGRGGG